ncbi:MAG TPA: ATP-binding protein [Gemmatimonadaceae bacterium]|nr:ATP-binding protein [Gemmatimonadaceae bacterium]
MTGPIPSSSDLDRFSNNLQVSRENAETRFNALAGGTPREGDTELLAALEELSVAEEELRAQHESLLEVNESLELERERYRMLFHLAPDPYIVTNEAGMIEEANAAATTLLGRQSSPLVDRSFFMYLDNESRQSVGTALANLATSGRVDKWRLTLRTAANETVQVEATVSVGQGVGGSGSIYWLLRDMTEHLRNDESMRALNRSLNARVAQRTRELELALEGEQSARKEAEAANRIKTELFARLSHEFRTPLHAVSGYLEILQQNIHGGLTLDQRRDVERIHQAQEHLMALVNMILDFAKLEGGPIELSMAEIPIEETLRAADALLEPQFAKKEITYTHHTGDSTLTVFADREKVQQIILNLLANAMRFTPSGGAVDLDWRIENDNVVVRVRDTGPGIPDAKTEQIFEPFVQLREPGSAPSGGTGLGLAISRDLARAMGGDVNVKSSVGAGSVFTLTLPLRKHVLASKLSAPDTAG